MKKKFENDGLLKKMGLLKILVTMKFTLLLFLLTTVQVFGTVYSQGTKLTVNMQNATLVEILDNIENQSMFKFLYNNDLLDNKSFTDLRFNDKTVEEILDVLLRDTGSKYSVLQNNLIVISPDRTGTQQKMITGKVTSDDGAPLPGVTVIIKGTTLGTVTDVDGLYNLSVPNESKTLVFSFIGMKSQEVEIGNQASVNVVMASDVIGLEEVIAVGYGTMRKSDLTGSVTRVSVDDKALMPNTNLLQSLSGAAGGVNVVQTGFAGGEPTFSIRGKTSLSASDSPLIVLDGIIYNGSISNININDVESIDILKDASAAAVYGSRSANGVMIITTKKGKTEKPTVSFNMYYGYQDMTNNPMKVMNAEQYAIRLTDYYYQQSLYSWYKTNPTSDTGKPARPDVTNRETVASRLRTQEEKDNYLAGNEIDWVDEITEVAPIQNYNLSFSGRTERSSYFISGSYSNEEGILLNDEFSRITVRSNVESKITDWLTLGINTSYSYRDYSGIEANLGHARSASPLANNKIGTANYDMYLTGENYMTYPLVNLYVDNSDIRNDLFLSGNAKVTIPWVQGLTYDINYANTYYTRNNNTFWPVTTPDGSGNKGKAVKNPTEERNWILNNIITYLRNFGDHQVNATLLYSREYGTANSSTLTAEGFDNPALGYNNMGLGTIATVASTAWEQNSISYMARANYSYKSRYMVAATIRRDGFSGFGANNKFASFPSFSAGWVISDEPFLADMEMPYLKFRASYGFNGNQGLGRYKSFSTMGTTSYVYGPTTSIGVYPNTLGNANLAWEKTASLNLGLDFGFLDQRITGSVDVYKAKTSDVLVKRALPPATGYENVWTNLGGIDNKGIEIGLNTINLQGAVRWESGFTFSLNRDKITKLYGGEEDKDVGNSWFVGESISAIYDYEMAGGLWTEADLYSGNILANWYPGQYKYVDQGTADGVIEPNADRKIIGYKNPSYQFSISNMISYKNFGLSFLLNSMQGGKNYFLRDNAGVVNVAWRSDDVLRINASAVRPYWTPDNGVNNATGVYNSPAVSSGIYESRSFVRLQDISLSYKLGKNALNKLKMNDLQIYIAGKNLYTWTKWSGWDPETVRDDDSNTTSNEANAPLMRNIILGVKLSL